MTRPETDQDSMLQAPALLIFDACFFRSTLKLLGRRTELCKQFSDLSFVVATP